MHNRALCAALLGISVEPGNALRGAQTSRRSQGPCPVGKQAWGHSRDFRVEDGDAGLVGNEPLAHIDGGGLAGCRRCRA